MNIKEKRCRAWARYINHYGHIPSVVIGGWGAARAMDYGRRRGHYYHVRRQQKHAFMTGYPR